MVVAEVKKKRKTTFREKRVCILIYIKLIYTCFSYVEHSW